MKKRYLVKLVEKGGHIHATLSPSNKHTFFITVCDIQKIQKLDMIKRAGRGC